MGGPVVWQELCGLHSHDISTADEIRARGVAYHAAAPEIVVSCLNE